MDKCLLMFLLLTVSCSRTETSDRLSPGNEKGGHFFKVSDGSEIYVWEHVPVINPSKTIYIISGVTGINHNSEKDIIDLLSNNKNRVVIIHPRGTGYSEGIRGDTDPNSIIADYCEIINGDRSYSDSTKKVILFGHSMSCALALDAARKLPGVDGLILVNPPYKLKSAKGMSPGLIDYLKYIGYYLFAPHSPVVNMAGDPSSIMDASDRMESEQRNLDSLLVKYFSMRCLTKSKKIMNSMIINARQVEFPLLLLYGENDNIVDKSGCDEIYSSWQGKIKSYVIIKGGSHGKSTILKGAENIHKWLLSNCL